MKKNTRKNTRLFRVFLCLVIMMVSSIALSLHFYSNFQEVKQSQEQLNEQYKRVLLENEELRIVILGQEKKSSGLLEQSQMEIEKLNKENENLRRKVAEFEKKAKKHPVASRGQRLGDWTYYRLTYYDNNEQSTGKKPGDPAYGITASGRPTQKGVSIAVDTDIIPLGTWVLIKWPDGRIEKRRADDTGSAIQGHDIDYYVPHATLAMGDEIVQVKILGNE